VKFLLVLLIGLAAGVAIGLGLLFYNPFTSQLSLSPLAVSDRQQITLRYSAVAEDSIVLTNNGETLVRPNPSKVLQLWEGPISKTDTLVTVLRDGRNETVGIGVKFSSLSERTNLLNGKALIDSSWYIYLPGQGSMLIEQSENHWTFLREVIIPAHWNSGNKWRGTWHGTITDGPGALGTGRVYGGSGRFSGLDSEAIETHTAKAYSTDVGPVAMEGQLTIDLSVEVRELSDDEFAVDATTQ
jgi:hypothetical protein